MTLTDYLLDYPRLNRPTKIFTIHPFELKKITKLSFFIQFNYIALFHLRGVSATKLNVFQMHCESIHLFSEDHVFPPHPRCHDSQQVVCSLQTSLLQELVHTSIPSNYPSNNLLEYTLQLVSCDHKMELEMIAQCKRA